MCPPPCLLSPFHLILSLTTQLLSMIWATQKGGSLHNASSIDWKAGEVKTIF